jgi:AcrR family transcriptional regulator
MAPLHFRYITVSGIIGVSLADVKEEPVVVRLTREESRARTRGAVIEAATSVFARRGFAGASMEEIAAEAGFTRGAVYSNFADKADLFLAVIEEREHRRVREVSEIYDSSADPAMFFASLAESNLPRTDTEQWVILRVEFWLYAMRNPEVRPRLVERNRELIASVEKAVGAILERAGIEPLRPLRDLAAVVYGLDEGLSMLGLLDPEATPRNLYLDTLGLLLESAAALDREWKRSGASGTSPGSAPPRRRRG